MAAVEEPPKVPVALAEQEKAQAVPVGEPQKASAVAVEAPRKALAEAAGAAPQEAQAVPQASEGRPGRPRQGLPAIHGRISSSGPYGPRAETPPWSRNAFHMRDR